MPQESLTFRNTESSCATLFLLLKYSERNRTNYTNNNTTHYTNKNTTDNTK